MPRLSEFMKKSLKSAKKFLPSPVIAWSGAPRIHHYFKVCYRRPTSQQSDNFFTFIQEKVVLEFWIFVCCPKSQKYWNSFSKINFANPFRPRKYSMVLKLFMHTYITKIIRFLTNYAISWGTLSMSFFFLLLRTACTIPLPRHKYFLTWWSSGGQVDCGLSDNKLIQPN